MAISTFSEAILAFFNGYASLLEKRLYFSCKKIILFVQKDYTFHAKRLYFSCKMMVLFYYYQEKLLLISKIKADTSCEVSAFLGFTGRQ